MSITPGASILGFTVTRIRDIPGKAAQLVEMVYEKTGTELAWVRSSEQNKLFSITFKTLPEDSTGVFHILEHSVLCGSEKFPVKEPFVELLKSSMNTFLNAMTFPDKTMYPVSSRNQRDFLNLVSVYLDAVFAPRILTNPNIFYQEGWHYETDGDNLTYNGVVFNEMKGAMSGVDGVVHQAVQDLLFPDSCYGHNSGGDPAAIPDLTYDQFLDSYRKNYHPSNARVFLDGDVPLEDTLALIGAYLDRFQPGGHQEVLPQTPVAREMTVSYEAAPGEDLSTKSQLVLAKITGSWEDKTRNLAVDVLCDVLAGSNDAPLKAAVLNARLGQNVTMHLTDGVFQPWLALRVHNMDHNNAEKIRDLIRSTVQNLVEQGLPKQELTASINRLAFQTKDMHEPQGLIRCISAMYSWLYGGDPMMYMSYDDAFDALREMSAGDGFEQLLKELLLEEDTLCVLHAVPSTTHGQVLRERENARLAAEKAAMSPEELEQINVRAGELKLWQQSTDSAEALATLPVLNLEEISEEPADLGTVIDTVSGVTLLRHETGTNGIVHLNAYFALTDRTLEELTAVSFLTDLLGKLPTARFDAAALQNQIKTYLGRLSFEVDVFAKFVETETCMPMLCARCSVLKENLAIAEDLLAEILTATDFSQPERIRQILQQSEMKFQQAALRGGHQFAARCAAAGFTAQGAAAEAISAYTPARWLHDFSGDFDARVDGFTTLAKDVLDKAICTARLTLSVTSDERTDLSGFIARLPAGTAATPGAHYQTTLPRKLGIRIPAQVSFASMGYHMARCGKAYQGTIRLVSNMISLGYLWNAIRVQGGAYGAGLQAGRNGSLFTYSFRDPSPARSLGVYREMNRFLSDFLSSGETLDKFIISTISKTEPLVTPRQQGITADQFYFSGLTHEDAVRERRELLHATMDDLRVWQELFASMANDAGICVVGHSGALEACADEDLELFDL